MKWIIFDMMGVICTTADDVNDCLIPYIHRYNTSCSKADINDLYMQASLGKLSSQHFFECVGINEPEKAFETYIASSLGINPKFIECVTKLKDKYKIGLLSNDVEEWSHYFRTLHGIEAIFDAVVISSCVHSRKPDSLIYETFLSIAHTQANDCLYIDDRYANIVRAETLGFNVLLFNYGEDSTYKQIKDFDELDQYLSF